MAQPIYLAKITSDKLEKLLCDFEKKLELTDRKKSSRSYLGDVRRFTKWFSRMQSFNPVAVTPLDLVQYREYLQKEGGKNGEGAKPATVNRALTSLSIFFKWLKEENQISYNPVEDIKLVATSLPPSPKWLSRNDQAALMRAVKVDCSARDEAIVGLMLHAGLRVSEVCNLKVGDIEISERIGQVSVTGKGNKFRQVPLNKTIRKTLSRWLEENPNDPLFPGNKGKPITTRGVFYLVANYAYNARLEGVTPHSLRHTFCKNAVDLGISLDQIALMAGHSSIDITKRYTMPSMNDLQMAVDKMSWE